MIQNDADLTRAGIVIADIYKKIGERKKINENSISVERTGKHESEEKAWKHRLAH